MIAIVVPANDEEERIEKCVKSLVNASSHSGLRGEIVQIIVVLDACMDRTGQIARRNGAFTIDVHARNVGLARQTGAKHALSAGARWLAFTDADSVVAADWLTCQLALKADAVCGTVAVDDWGHYGQKMHQHFDQTYSDREEHKHIHGANLGVSAAAYVVAGGFKALESSEDVALVESLKNTGARIAWSSKPRVVTSTRSDYKAPGGFGATLQRIQKTHLREALEGRVLQ